MKEITITSLLLEAFDSAWAWESKIYQKQTTSNKNMINSDNY